MKFDMSHYGHKSILEAKFKSGSCSSFGDMTSQNFPRKKGTSHQIRLFTPGKRVQLLKNEFYVQNRSSPPKIDPPCLFQQFPSRGKFFHFVNFWDISMRKEPQQPPD